MKELSYVIGIDPGLSGALALLNEDSKALVDLLDMPVMAGTGKRQQVNGAALTKLFKLWNAEGYVKCAYLEKVSAMPGQGVSSMFSFGMSYGILQGVLCSLGIPIVMVSPQFWKKRAGLLKQEKDRARTLAQQLYPLAELDRKKDLGRADAILIARFGTI